MSSIFSELVLAQVDRHTPGRQVGGTEAWVTRRLGEELWSKQRLILQRLETERRVAVKSAHGTGKSHTASRAAARFLDDNPVGDAFLVSTAPSFGQVRTILWRYIGQAHRKGGLLGRVNQTEWLVGNELIGVGRKPADYDTAAFTGIHARKILVVIDEAGGVPKVLWDAVETLLTNEDAHVLAIGNPDDPTSHFATVCMPNSGWCVETISAFDTPNFTGELVSAELAAQLVGPRYVEDAKRNWGEDSPLYVSKVLGEFPEDAEDGVIPGSAIARCRNLNPENPYRLEIRTRATHNDHDGETDVQLGVDVGAGGDQSVIRERRGNRAARVWRSRHGDPTRLTQEIVSQIRRSRARKVCIDSIGIGWGIHGSVKKACQDESLVVDVVAVNVATKSSQPRRFANLRAELWWMGRELTLDERWDLSQLEDQTAADLAAPKYSLDTSGRIVIEAKDEVRQRLGRSPDDADALLLAFYQGTQQVAVRTSLEQLARPMFTGRPGQATVGAR